MVLSIGWTDCQRYNALSTSYNCTERKLSLINVVLLVRVFLHRKPFHLTNNLFKMCTNQGSCEQIPGQYKGQGLQICSKTSHTSQFLHSQNSPSLELITNLIITIYMNWIRPCYQGTINGLVFRFSILQISTIINPCLRSRVEDTCTVAHFSAHTQRVK